MFIDRTDLIVLNHASLDHGICVTDLDGDGQFELVIGCMNGPNRVLKWSAGCLNEVTPHEIADPHGSTQAIAAADIDGDGVEEVYFANSFHEMRWKRDRDRLLKRTAEGRWIDLQLPLVTSSIWRPSSERTVTAMDRRGIGRYGFFVANSGQSPHWFELGVDGQLIDLVTSLELDRLHDVHGSLAAPLFGPHSDLLCTNAMGSNVLFRNRHDGTLEACSQSLGLCDDQEASHCVAGFEANGDWALLWANLDGPHRLMRRQPGDRWKDHATPALAFPSAVMSIIVADFDNDGYDELFLHNHGEPNRLFRFSPDDSSRSEDESAVTMIEIGSAEEPNGSGTGAAVADVDGDGVLELLLAHGNSKAQPLSLYRVPQASVNNWLRVLPQTRFGAPARGAVVTICRDERLCRKLIDGGGGSRCQMEPVAHFGLGRGSRVDTVMVQWPDGATLSFDDPDVNCTYIVPYPRG